MARSAYKTPLGATPKQGQRSLPITYNFTNQAAFNDDLSPEIQMGEIEFVQAVYVDNSGNPNPLTIIFLSGPQQPLTVPAFGQGIYPVIAIGLVKYTITTVQGAVNVKLIWLNNYQGSYTQWGPINLTVTNVNPAQGTFTNRGATLAVAGTSQILAAANAARKAIFIENPATATGQGIAAAESVYINFTTAAGVDNGTSFEITPGGYWPPASYNTVTTEQINFNAATIGHRIIAKEM